MTEAQKKVIVTRLNEISGTAGTLTPEAVLADAADPTSVLHSCFEWDDSKAAHQYRLDQARGLIRIRMTYVVDEVEIKAPFFIRTPSAPPTQQGYTSVVQLRSDKDSARAALRAEINRVMASLERARNVAAVLGLTDEFNAMMRATTQLEAAMSNAVDAVAAG